jgi:hypothetical protein
MSVHDAPYIGTLLIENIQKKKKGTPSIELLISLDANGEFSASAYDLDHPEDKHNHILTVSLSPEHDLTSFDGIDLEREDTLLKDETSGNIDKFNKYATNVKTPKSAIIIISAIILVMLVALGLWFFLFRSRPAEDSGTALTEIPAVEAVVEAPPPPPPVEQLEVTPPQAPVAEEETPVIKAPDVPVAAAPRKRPPAPVSSYKVPSVIPAGGVSYRLRWGDTLWDVSQAFYRTPWRYRYIANYNGIRNPNRIISGRTIKIPPLPR